MRQSFERGIVAITLLVPEAAEVTGGGIPALARLLSRYKLPATWAVATAAAESLARLADVAGPAEVAIWAADSWSAPGTSRSQFARELARRVGVAAALAQPLQSLVAGVSPPADRLDLLVKHGIRAVACTADEGPAARRPAVAVLRHRLFAVAARAFWPARRIGWLSSPATAFRHQLRRVTVIPDVLQLAVDLAVLVGGGQTELGRLERLVGLAADAVGRGQVEAATLSGVADRLMPARLSPPARSILRAA